MSELSITNLQLYMTQVFNRWNIKVLNGEVMAAKPLGHEIEIDQILPDHDIIIEYWQSGPSGWKSYRTTKTGKLRAVQCKKDVAKTIFYLWHLRHAILWVDQRYFKMTKDPKTGVHKLSQPRDQELQELMKTQIFALTHITDQVGVHPLVIYQGVFQKFKRFDNFELIQDDPKWDNESG